MITILNYGCGNIKAIQNVFDKIGVESRVANCLEDLKEVDKLILPGVGSFDYAMQKLMDSGMFDRLNQLVLLEKKPVLGICVGVQLMTNSSEEGLLKGLGWIDAEVRKFDEDSLQTNVNLPHMGWNDVNAVKTNMLFDRLEENAKFYFLHSYYISCNNKEQILAKADYGGEFVCAVSQDNICGVQFHPEKSHQYGVKLLENFSKIIL